MNSIDFVCDQLSSASGTSSACDKASRTNRILFFLKKKFIMQKKQKLANGLKYMQKNLSTDSTTNIFTKLYGNYVCTRAV